MTRKTIISLAIIMSLFLLGTSLVVAIPIVADAEEETEDVCNLLDDQEVRFLMSGMLETKLLITCGRESELGGVNVSQEFENGVTSIFSGIDVLVNDPSGDTGGGSHTQSETSISLNENTGTICSGYNDSWHYFAQGMGFTGLSRSVDGGATFTDGGALSASSFGDPSIIWRRSDGKFYIATLHTSGLALWRSDDDCTTFTFHDMIHTSTGDDKEIITVDNNVASPNYGRIYVAWIDFNASSRIYSSYSDDGLTWSPPLAVSSTSGFAQGAWPTVAPNGDIYISWVRWNPYFAGPIDIEIVRSTNGGVSFSFVTNPLTGGVGPYDLSATSSCGRPAINGNIRIWPLPQIVISPNGDLHVVYAYDPDGRGTGDVINVYYRRSVDNGTTWEPEIQLNDDGTITDQWFPTISAGPGGRIISTWYDRRLDPGNNYLFDYYMRVSHDGGITWEPSERVSDVSSPVYIDPNLATCYHGDYDTQIQDAAYGYIQWSDDRNVQDGHNDPDVWFERETFSPDFTLEATPENLSACVGSQSVYDVVVGSLLGYSGLVTLTTQGEPPGATAVFNPNPVTPPITSTLTISEDGGSPAETYNIDIVGMSTTRTHTTTVELLLFRDVPPAITPVAPADGATDIAVATTFTWTQESDATDYTLTVASDPAFNNVVYMTTTGKISHTLPILLAADTTYYWQVSGTNPCGPGAASTVSSFTTRAYPKVMLVDDDDNFPDTYLTYAFILNTMGVAYDVWDTDNSDDEPPFMYNEPYETVIWFTGDSNNAHTGPGPAGEAGLSNFLYDNKCLMMSSQSYYNQRGLTPFMDTELGVDSVNNDTGQTMVTGAGGVFGGLGPYNLSYFFTNQSDTVNPDGTAATGFDGNAGSAAVYNDFGYRTTFFGFPYVTIPNTTGRVDTMSAFLDWCNQLHIPAVSDDQVGSTWAGQAISYTFTITNDGAVFDEYLFSIESQWDFTQSLYESGPAFPGNNVEVTIVVQVPAGATVGEMDTATLTVRSLGASSIAVTAEAVTTVIEEPPPPEEDVFMYLPLVFKQP